MKTYETYVSLETAKLLKQAGFDWRIYDGYILYENDNSFVTQFQTPHNFNGNNGELFNNYLHHKEILSRPTLAVAQKWLREVKGWEMFVGQTKKQKVDETWQYAYMCEIHNRNAKYETFDGYTNAFDKYEDAQEDGIKYCLYAMFDGDTNAFYKCEYAKEDGTNI